jgi:hypothetical protein
LCGNIEQDSFQVHRIPLPINLTAHLFEIVMAHGNAPNPKMSPCVWRRSFLENVRQVANCRAILPAVPSIGLQELKHIVVLMVENPSSTTCWERSKQHDSRIDGLDGLDGSQWNPDSNGGIVKVKPLAEFQEQLDPDPDHHFAGVNQQLFNGNSSPHPMATMQGFVKSYFNQRHVEHSHEIMYYFPVDKLPVLATEFAVFNRWFSSIPGLTLLPAVPRRPRGGHAARLLVH